MSKKLSIVNLSILFLSLFFSGCAPTCSYSSIQRQENILKMEIIYVSDDYGSRFEDVSNAQVVQIIESEQWKQVLIDFKNLSCSKVAFDPSYSIFGKVIRITYVDSTIELLSDCTIATYNQGDWNLTSHTISHNEYEAFINEYTGLS